MIEGLIKFVFSYILKGCTYKKIPLAIRILILIPFLFIYAVIIWASINIAIETNILSERIIFGLLALFVLLSLIPFVKKVFY